MTYKLAFVPAAHKEWEKLGNTVRAQFKNKLQQRLEDPHVTKDKLYGFTNVYKIKLRAAGYRLVYEVNDKEILVLVLAVGKRDKNEAYNRASKRKI